MTLLITPLSLSLFIISLQCLNMDVCFNSTDHLAKNATLMYDAGNDENSLWSKPDPQTSLPVCISSLQPSNNSCIVCVDKTPQMKEIVRAVCRNVAKTAEMIMEAPGHTISISKSGKKLVIYCHSMCWCLFTIKLKINEIKKKSFVLCHWLFYPFKNVLWQLAVVCVDTQTECLFYWACCPNTFLFSLSWDVDCYMLKTNTATKAEKSLGVSRLLDTGCVPETVSIKY